MKKILISAIMIGVMASAAFATPYGFLYSDVKEPVSATASNNYTKSAEGSNYGILGLVGIGDSGVEKIAKSANIKTVKFVDKRTLWITPLFQMETFKVYGD